MKKLAAFNRPRRSITEFTKPVTYRYPEPDQSSPHPPNKISCSVNNLCQRCQSSWQYAGCKADVLWTAHHWVIASRRKNSETESVVLFCMQIICNRNALLSRNPLSINVMLVSLGRTCKGVSQNCTYSFSSTCTWCGLVTDVTVVYNLRLGGGGHVLLQLREMMGVAWVLYGCKLAVKIGKYSGKLDSSGAFAKLWKAAVNFVMSVCLPVCLSVRMEQLGSHWMDFYYIW